MALYKSPSFDLHQRPKGQRLSGSEEMIFGAENKDVLQRTFKFLSDYFWQSVQFQRQSESASAK